MGSLRLGKALGNTHEFKTNVSEYCWISVDKT